MVLPTKPAPPCYVLFCSTLPTYDPTHLPCPALSCPAYLRPYTPSLPCPTLPAHATYLTTLDLSFLMTSEKGEALKTLLPSPLLPVPYFLLLSRILLSCIIVFTKSFFPPYVYTFSSSSVFLLSLGVSCNFLSLFASFFVFIVIFACVVNIIASFFLVFLSSVLFLTLSL